MSNLLALYAASRDALLAQITSTLKNDERSVAAWLTGSFGRGEQDNYSDLDLRVVVADQYSETLCTRPWPYGARTTTERLAFFSQFGKPSVIYDAHGNAPEGGSFTYVLYLDTALNVDWILVPKALARRGEKTFLLFDKAGIPMEEPSAPASREQRAQEASVQIGFFWLMTPVAIKYMLRNEPVAFQDFLETLHEAVETIKGLIAGEPVAYRGSSYAPLCVTQGERIAAVRSLCETVQQLMPEVVQMGGYIPPSPMPVVNTWLAMAGHPELRKAYAANREAMLGRIVETLQQDERFTAAWLAGSYARGEQDDLSDLDLRIVVAEPYIEQFCAVPWESAVAKTTPERLAFVSQFGNPGIVWESKSWVAENSCFILTLDEHTGLHIDWVFVPQANARQERESVVLFDKAGIPVEPAPEPESQEQRAIAASDKVGFFWMIAASCIKYLIRSDLSRFHILLDWLHNSLYEVKSILDGIPEASLQYHRGAKLVLTREEQIAALRDLCHRMLALMPEVVQLGGYIPESPMIVVEKRLAIARD